MKKAFALMNIAVIVILSACQSFIVPVRETFDNPRNIGDEEAAFLVVPPQYQLKTLDGKSMSLETISFGGSSGANSYCTAARILPGSHTAVLDYDVVTGSSGDYNFYYLTTTTTHNVAKDIKLNFSAQAGYLHIVREHILRDSLNCFIESGPMRMKSPDGKSEIFFDIRHSTAVVSGNGAEKRFLLLPQKLCYSPDKKRTAFITYEPMRWIDASDDKPFPHLVLGYPYQYNAEDAQWFAVVDGVPGGLYNFSETFMYGPLFSADSRHYACDFCTDKTQFWIVDGVKLREYDVLSHMGRVFFDSKNRLVYGAKAGESWVTVSGDTEIAKSASYDDMYNSLDRLWENQ